MARIWSERYDSAKHKDKMWGQGPAPHPERDLVDKLVYFVNVCQFTFEFHSIEQIEACLEFFSQKIRPTSRVPNKDRLGWGGDRWEEQRWYDRLPHRLLKEPKRQKLVSALERALDQFRER